MRLEFLFFLVRRINRQITELKSKLKLLKIPQLPKVQELKGAIRVYCRSGQKNFFLIFFLVFLTFFSLFLHFF